MFALCSKPLNSIAKYFFKGVILLKYMAFKKNPTKVKVEAVSGKHKSPVNCYSLKQKKSIQIKNN